MGLCFDFINLEEKSKTNEQKVFFDSLTFNLKFLISSEWQFVLVFYYDEKNQ